MASENVVEQQRGDAREEKNEDCQDTKTEILSGTPENNLESGEHMSQKVPTEMASSIKDDVDVVGDGSWEKEPVSSCGEALAVKRTSVMAACSVDADGETISSVEANAARSQAAQIQKEEEQARITDFSQETGTKNTCNCEKTELGNLKFNDQEAADEKTELEKLTCNNQETGAEKSKLAKLTSINTEEKDDEKTEPGSLYVTYSDEEMGDEKKELEKSTYSNEETGDEKTEQGNLHVTYSEEETGDEKSEQGNLHVTYSNEETGHEKIELGKATCNSEEAGDNKKGYTNVTNHTNNEETELASVTGTNEETKEKPELVKTTCNTEKALAKAHPDNGEANVNKMSYSVEADVVDKSGNNAEIPDTKFQRHNEDTTQQTDCHKTSANASKTEVKESVKDTSVLIINPPVSSYQAHDTFVLKKCNRTHEVVLATQDIKTNPSVEDTLPEGLETSASSEINHSAHIHSPTEENARERDGVVVLNLLPDDLINVRLSHLSDISEENDTQLDAESGSGDTYQVLESGVVQDCERSVSAGDEEQPGKCRDTAGEVTYITMDPPNLDHGTSPNGKGDCLSESCSERISTEAVIENTGTESSSDRIDGGDQVTVEDRDSLPEDLPTDEEQGLLVPKAECDSIDLMDEDGTPIQNEPLPDPKNCQPDPKASPGVQRVTKAFIQTRYKNMSKKRRFYTTVIKYILFFFNFKCWVAGASATIAGSWMIAEKRKMVRDALDFFLDPAIILCVSGTIIFIVAFFGFVGALRENILLLKIWHISLSLFLVAELIFGALVFIFYFFPGIRRDLNLAPEDWGLKEAIRKYKDDQGMRDWIDMIQREMKCCGVTNSDEGYKDWQDNVYYKCTEENLSPDKCAVPPSCCIIEPGDYYNSMCGYNTNNKEVWEVERDIYTQGCVQGFGMWLQRHAVLIGAVFTGIVVPQFIGIVMARVYIKLTTTKHVQSRWKKWKVKSLARVTGDSSAKATDV